MAEEKKTKKLLISKKKLAANIIIMVAVTGLTIFTLVKNNVFTDLSALKNMKWYTYLVLCISVMIYVLCDSFVIYRSFKHINKGLKYKDAVGCYLYGNLGSSVTPSKSGHLPFIFYFLQRKGNSFSQALNSQTQCQIIYTIDQSILYTIMAIVCYVKKIQIVVNGTTIDLYWMGLIGLGLALFASGVFLLMAFCPPINKILVRILAWFSLKTKKVQTKEEYIQKQEEKMQIVRDQIKYMFTHFQETLPSLIVYMGFMICNNCLPYIIYCCVSLKPFEFTQLCYFFALYQALGHIANITPIPGNSGVAEATFVALFANAIENNYLGATLLLWRLFTYYLLLLVDLAYFITCNIILDAKEENKLEKIMEETQKGYTPNVHSHFDTMEMELLSINFKNTQCYNCCHLQNNLFQCDKYKDKPDEILRNTKVCPFYEERENEEGL